MASFYLKQIEIGPMANFTYLLGCKDKRECVVVDPAWDVKKIMTTAESEEMKITGILVSHFHPDHIGGHLWGHDIEGVNELLDIQAMPVYANKAEVAGITTLTHLSKSDITTIDSGEDLQVGNTKIKCIHTPGHTPGSQCFLCDDQFLVSGDTLFLQGCGRVDLPGGSPEDMYYSLTQKLAKLPGDTVLFPGHHYSDKSHDQLSTVLATNPYLTASSFDDWKRLMGS